MKSLWRQITKIAFLQNYSIYRNFYQWNLGENKEKKKEKIMFEVSFKVVT